MLVADYRVLANASRIEHEILDHAKQALRITLDWQTPEAGLPRKMASLHFVMNSFCRHLRRIMELEEQDGYLQVVAEQNPNLDARIRRLFQDHARFRRKVDDLAPSVETAPNMEREAFESLCREIRELLDQVDRHDASEIELLQESFLTDEGGEG